MISCGSLISFINFKPFTMVVLVLENVSNWIINMKVEIEIKACSFYTQQGLGGCVTFPQKKGFFRQILIIFGILNTLAQCLSESVKIIPVQSLVETLAFLQNSVISIPYFNTTQQTKKFVKSLIFNIQFQYLILIHPSS